MKLLRGISKATDKLTKEEVESLDELSKKTLGSYIEKAANSGAIHHADVVKKKETADEVDRFTNRNDMNDKYAERERIKKSLGASNADINNSYRKVSNRFTGLGRAVKRLTKEEVEELDEAIGAKDKQDEGEYGYEGDMAMSQLRTIIRNCQEMMKVLDKETDMPEWVQSKITLATDYLQTANDYLMSELEEETEINELSKGLMYRYFSKADKGGSEKRYAGMKLAAQKTIPLKSSVKIQGTGELDPAKEDKRMRKEEVAKDAPFEGGREVKSKESAAVRVKKIAKGMEKLNTPKKDNK